MFNTLFLAFWAAVISVPLAITLGLLAVRYRNRWPDKLISAITLTTISLPEFVVGYIAMYFLAVKYRIFSPTSTFFLTALFAPLIAPYGMADVVGDSWEPASARFLLGTDSIGRDLLNRMIYGGRTTILVAIAATTVSFVTGSVLGFSAAVLGGWMDQGMSRFVDLIMAIPTLILAW